MPFLDERGLAALGLASVGRGVRVSDMARLYNPGAITLADGVRIDDFCILSAGAGGIRIGRHVHIACYSSLIGQGAMVFEDFSGISSRVSVYSSSDDFGGEGMAHPTIPERYRKVQTGDVVFRRHSLVGAGSVVLPGVTLGEGASVGALSLVKDDLAEFGLYAGVPARRIGDRSRKLLEMERRFLAEGG